jgi:flavin reductase (DIM6/NTAB) family NADH-FMN oxidoreductase RutF
MEAADHSSLDFPPEVDEMHLTKLTKIPSVLVLPPRVAEAAMHLECVVRHIHVAADSTTKAPSAHIILAEVVMIHVSSAVSAVNHKGHTVIDNAKYEPVARLGGNLYCGTGQLYESWSKVLKA